MQQLPLSDLLNPFVRSLYIASGAESLGLSFDHFALALQEVSQDYLPPAAPETARIAFFKTLHIKDLALAQACSLGSALACEHFLVLYRPRILLFARAIARNDSLAQDLSESLLGDLFGAAANDRPHHSKFASYTGRGSLEGWLRAILTRAHLDRCRSSRRFVSLENHPGFLRALTVTHDRELSAPDSRLAGVIEQALLECAPKDRFLLAAHFFDGRTLAELARILDVHESTVSRRLNRLITRIRRNIKQDLRRRGMTERQIKESLQADVRQFSLDLCDRLLQGANPGQE